MRHPAAMGEVRRVATRTLFASAALIAALIVTTVANVSPAVRAAEPMKAVVIVGPAHSATSSYLRYGETIAQVAEAEGLVVSRVFHPDATWARVKREMAGAKLVFYLGHGFGWPSPYGPKDALFEEQMNGFGLNWPAGDPRRSQNDVHYYGGDRIRDAEIRLGANAVVVLNHLCYSAGFGESGQAAPSQSIAVQRVDNFAAAFLGAGASVVMALAYQPAESVIPWLMNRSETMEDVFKRRRNQYGDSAAGWVGWNPTYHDSVRTPGATVLLDPHPQQSYRRAITGNLAMTTNEWRGQTAPDDTVAPEMTQFSGAPTEGTTPAGDGAPVITPNGDGHSDAFQMSYSVSEPSHVDFAVTDRTGQTVRSFTRYTGSSGAARWNGRGNDGEPVPDGRYDITATPRDLAGNVGPASTTSVRVFRTMSHPGASTRFFFARDGDALKASTTLGVTIANDATLDWLILDRNDEVVRTFMRDQAVTVGDLSQEWDGRDDDGAYVPDGTYTQLLRASTDAGSYSHRLPLTVAPFKLKAPRWSAPAGTTLTFRMRAAEPVSGWPDLHIIQPGLRRFRATPVRYSARTFRFTVTFRSGGEPGTVLLKLSANDTSGGSQRQTFTFTLE